MHDFFTSVETVNVYLKNYTTFNSMYLVTELPIFILYPEQDFNYYVLFPSRNRQFALGRSAA